MKTSFGEIVYPNIRDLFVSDLEDYDIYDIDLKGADAQVVAAEADDEDLLSAFAAGLDVHAKNAEDMLGPQWRNASKEEQYFLRKQQKTAVHGTNYGATPYALSHQLGWDLRKSEAFQRRWFSLHPKIKDWHKRILNQLKQPTLAKRAITNIFGYRIFFFDRIEENFKAALAYIPQSTVALVTRKAMVILSEKYPQAILVMQVHDSLVFLFPRSDRYLLPKLVKDVTIPLPYPKALSIPWEVSRHENTWGECEKLNLGSLAWQVAISPTGFPLTSNSQKEQKRLKLSIFGRPSQPLPGHYVAEFGSTCSPFNGSATSTQSSSQNPASSQNPQQLVSE